MTNQKSNELWAIYDKTEQQQQIIENQKNQMMFWAVPTIIFNKTHDNHNIVYFIH